MLLDLCPKPLFPYTSVAVGPKPCAGHKDAEAKSTLWSVLVRAGCSRVGDHVSKTAFQVP